MKCPQCKRKMKITHTHESAGVVFRRALCVCGCRATTQEMIASINSRYGEGAAARANRHRLRGEDQGTPTEAGPKD